MKRSSFNCLTTKQNFALASCLNNFITEGKKFDGKDKLAAACIRVLGFPVTANNIDNIASATELNTKALLNRSTSNVSPLAQLFRRVETLEKQLAGLSAELGIEQKKLF